MSIEEEFKSLVRSIKGSIDIDLIPDSKFSGKKADFFLKNDKAIIEIKTISSDRSTFFQDGLNSKAADPKEYEKGMPVIFGTVPLQEVYKAHKNKNLFETQVNMLASRTLEEYIGNAKYQISDTKKHFNAKNSLGILVILNQGYDFYDTIFVYRSLKKMLDRIVSKTPELAIDGVYYINESVSNSPSTVFIHRSSISFKSFRSHIFLKNIHNRWEKHRGYCA